MALFGIDTSQAVSDELRKEAANLIGSQPKFWGRYFNGTASRKYQYDKSENLVLAKWGIPVLCFARQMSYLSNIDDAENHAASNMKGVVDAFGADYLRSKGLSPILYLDVEPEDSTHPPLPQKYYERWSAAICAGYKVGATTLPFRPAVYINRDADTRSWANLNAACAAGAVCCGLSVAHYIRTDDNDLASPPPAPAQMTWKDSEVMPKAPPHPAPVANIPVILWQYYGDYPRSWGPGHRLIKGDIDPNFVNPSYETLVMSGTVPAPAPAA